MGRGNPKASLMKRKRAAIVDAALEASLESGYAETSMDRIATSADVSIKTVYLPFKNKDDLFSAVMQAACDPGGPRDPDGRNKNPSLPLDRPWFSKSARTALTLAGTEYLRYILSRQQLALYRVVIRDAPRFPELGRSYRDQVAEYRIALFTHFLGLRAPAEEWKIKNRRFAASVFDALLRATLFENALQGLHEPSEQEIGVRARSAADIMLLLSGVAAHKGNQTMSSRSQISVAQNV
jgi:AcrR family transcriptional regulator